MLPIFLQEFQHFRRGKGGDTVINMNPFDHTTHVEARAGPHAQRSQSAKALIDTGSSHIGIVFLFRHTPNV